MVRKGIELPSREIIGALRRAEGNSGNTLTMRYMSPSGQHDLVVPAYWELTQSELDGLGKQLSSAATKGPKYFERTKRGVITAYEGTGLHPPTRQSSGWRRLLDYLTMP